MKILIAFLLLAAPAHAQPPAEPFCADLKRLAAGAEESPAFASLAGVSLHSLLGSYCVMPRPASIAHLCTRSLLPRGIDLHSVVGQMKKCLPEAQVMEDSYPNEGMRVEYGKLRIKVAEYGGEGAHVGRTVMIYIEAAPH